MQFSQFKVSGFYIFSCIFDTKILYLHHLGASVSGSCLQLWVWVAQIVPWLYAKKVKCQNQLWTTATFSMHVIGHISHNRSHLLVRIFQTQHCYWLIMNHGCNLPYDWSTHPAQPPRALLHFLVLFFFKFCW
jgi:hypothetical protein